MVQGRQNTPTFGPCHVLPFGIHVFNAEYFDAVSDKSQILVCRDTTRIELCLPERSRSLGTIARYCGSQILTLNGSVGTFHENDIDFSLGIQGLQQLCKLLLS